MTRKRNKKTKNVSRKSPTYKHQKHPKLQGVLPKGKRNRKQRQKQHNDLVDALEALSVNKPLTTEEILNDIYASLAAIKIPGETDLKS